MAAANNADWYALMWDVRGWRYRRDGQGFTAIDPPPPYHGSVVALHDAPVWEMIAATRDQPGFGVKDAAGCHDLSDLGLSKLFDASWLWHAWQVDATTDRWETITTADDLTRWEAGWAGGAPREERQFPPTMLARADVRLFGRRREDGFDAGVIANLSANCVGLSNLFGQDAWSAATALCAEFGGGLPLVGYERGDDKAAALTAGWVATGPLSVWVGAA